jgi:hypothetical protein
MTDEIIKTDFYLKLDSEVDMPTALSAFYKQGSHVETDEEGNENVVLDCDLHLVSHTADYAIDVVGVIHKPTGTMLTDDEGREYPEMAALDGWHVNIRLIGDNKRADVEALAAYFVDPEPTTPSRVWL